MQKKVLVAGCGGYIGNVLCRDLLNRGYTVLGFDNFHKIHCDGLLGILPHPNFEFKYSNICNYKECLELMQKDVDICINLAAIVGYPAVLRQPQLSESVTIGGCKNIINARNEVNKDILLFYPSTGSTFGKLDEICTEESPCNPTSLYGEHKLIAEKMVLNEENTLVYKLATLFGVSSCMRTNLLINNLCYDAYYNHYILLFEADAKRSFVHIKDISDAIIFGLENYKSLKYNLYNCGNQDLNYTKREVAEIIKETTGCYVHCAEVGKDMDNRDYHVSYERLYAEGWKPKVDLETGINELLKTMPLLNVVNRYS
jgi:nucleoside-diphosphate-sugar epimerase